MENWGLLTYSSSFLLVDDTPGHYTLPQVQLIALVTTHEIAHRVLETIRELIGGALTYFWLSVRVVVWRHCDSPLVE